MTLTPEQRSAYQHDGFVILSGVFSTDEVMAWTAECDRLRSLPGVFVADNLRTGVLNSERPPDRLDPVIDISPPFRALAFDPRITSVAAELLGEQALLFKDKLIFKPARTPGYKAHQDFAYWHWLSAPPGSLLTVLVAIDTATAENGAVEFFAGMHDRLLTEEGELADVADGDLPASGTLALTRPGDVVIFHSLMPHRSGFNHTDLARRQFYLSYAGASCGDLYRTYYDHLHGSLLAAMPDDARGRAYFK